ncbi:MAG: CRISPR-associated protein Cas4 [Anaerolineae bacterium]|nr:CRISPR-associated protein Cas4 [Anaerolineae bacterium]
MTALGLTLVGLGLVLAVAALVIWRRADRERADLGLPPGRVVSADVGAWQACARPLFSRRYRLAGKPDYLVRSGGRLVPVEVKPGRSADAPYASDLLQLGAYLLLVEEETGTRPSYGLLRYARHTFEIPYTRDLERRVVRTLYEMRQLRSARQVEPQHDEPWRCRRCGHREHCGAEVSRR